MTGTLAVVSAVNGLLKMFTKGVNPSDQVIAETFNIVRTLHGQNQFIAKSLLDLSQDIRVLREKIYSDMLRSAEITLEKEILAMEGVYQEITRGANAAVKRISTEETDVIKRIEAKETALKRADELYKHHAITICEKREQLFLRSDFSAPTIATAAWIDILYKYRAGFDIAEIKETARRYEKRIARVFDTDHASSLMTITQETEQSILNIRAEIGRRIGRDGPDESQRHGAGCVENYIYSEYQCNKASLKAGLCEMETGSPRFGMRTNKSQSMEGIIEALANPDKYKPARRATQIPLTRVVQWYQFRLYDRVLSREFDQYAIEYHIEKLVESAAKPSEKTSQSCQRVNANIDVTQSELYKKRKELHKLVEEHNALVEKLKAFHATLNLLEEAQANLVEFTDSNTLTAQSVSLRATAGLPLPNAGDVFYKHGQ